MAEGGARLAGPYSDLARADRADRNDGNRRGWTEYVSPEDDGDGGSLVVLIGNS